MKTTSKDNTWVKDDDASSLNTALAQENPAAYSHRHHYVSGLIARLISNKAPFLAVRAKDFASLSTPSQLKAFLARLRRGEVLGARAMRFCFALDGTLVNCVDDDFEDASPIHKNIQIARRDLGVPSCCGVFTCSIRLVSIARCRGWFLFRV